MNSPRHESSYRQSADLERLAFGPDGPIHDPEWGRRLEAEAPVVVRVSKQDDQEPARSLDALKQLGHQQTPDAASLTRRYDRKGCQADGGATIELTNAGHHVPDDYVAFNSDEVETGGRSAPPPRLRHDCCFFVPVALFTRKRFAHDPEHFGLIVRRCGPDANEEGRTAAIIGGHRVRLFTSAIPPA